MALHKNWSAIREIEDARFRLTVILMDEQAAAYLAIVFPELFCDEPHPNPSMIDLRARAGNEAYLREWDFFENPWGEDDCLSEFLESNE